MALDKLIDGQMHDREMLNTAEALRLVFGLMSDSKFAWETGFGFAAGIMRVTPTDARVTVKRGSVTLASAAAAITVTPEPGKTPFFCIVSRETVVYGSNGTAMCAHMKLFAALVLGSYTKNGFVGISARTVNNNITNATMSAPNSAVTWIDEQTGAISFTGQSGYMFPASDYQWYAFYWEDYGND